MIKWPVEKNCKDLSYKIMSNAAYQLMTESRQNELVLCWYTDGDCVRIFFNRRHWKTTLNRG